jgi:hypothetical protein
VSTAISCRSGTGPVWHPQGHLVGRIFDHDAKATAVIRIGEMIFQLMPWLVVQRRFHPTPHNLLARKTFAMQVLQSS